MFLLKSTTLVTRIHINTWRASVDWLSRAVNAAIFTLFYIDIANECCIVTITDKCCVASETHEFSSFSSNCRHILLKYAGNQWHYCGNMWMHQSIGGITLQGSVGNFSKTYTLQMRKLCCLEILRSDYTLMMFLSQKNTVLSHTTTKASKLKNNMKFP